MRILVTGGAGYVGSVLVPHLLALGHKVRVLGKGKLKQTPRDAAAAVIHLAAIVGYPACKREPRLAQEVNLNGTRMLDRKRSKDQSLLFASTGSKYGVDQDGRRGPGREATRARQHFSLRGPGRGV